MATCPGSSFENPPPGVLQSMVIEVALLTAAVAASTVVLVRMARGCVPLPPAPKRVELPSEFEDWDARFKRYREDPIEDGPRLDALLERAAEHDPNHPELVRRS